MLETKVLLLRNLKVGDIFSYLQTRYKLELVEISEGARFPVRVVALNLDTLLSVIILESLSRDVPVFVGNRITNFREYAESAASTAIYPQKDAVSYIFTGLVDEIGEIAGILKRAIRDNDGILSEEERKHLLVECGDLLWYLDRACYENSSSLEEVANNNVSKLADRKQRNVLHGKGDKR